MSALILTTPEKLAVIRAFAGSLTLREIGAVLSISGERVRQLSDRHGIKRTRPRSWRPEVKAARLAKMRAAGCFRGVPRKHSAALRAQAISLKGTMSASAIAAHLGLRSRNVVIGLWHRP